MNQAKAILTFLSVKVEQLLSGFLYIPEICLSLS